MNRAVTSAEPARLSLAAQPGLRHRACASPLAGDWSTAWDIFEGVLPVRLLPLTLMPLISLRECCRCAAAAVAASGVAVLLVPPLWTQALHLRCCWPAGAGAHGSAGQRRVGTMDAVLLVPQARSLTDVPVHTH